MKRREQKMNRRYIVIGLAVLLIVILGSFYDPFHHFYGYVEVTELEQEDNEYIMEISGEFGKRKAALTENDLFNVVEDDEHREDNISSIWSHLSKGETYQMIVKVHEKKKPFLLKRIYLDREL